MKRTLLFSFFLCLFAFGLNAQNNLESAEYMEEMAKQEGILQASVAKSDLQRGLDKSLERFEIAVNADDALEIKELESIIAAQIDQMISLQTDATEKTKQTSLLRSFQTLDKADKNSVKAVLTQLRGIQK